MIHTDRQLTITRDELHEAQTALTKLETGGGAGEPAWVMKTKIAALKSQISEFETDIAEYDMLRSRSVRVEENASLQELPRILIQARIASGLSQTDLAERLGMKAQQIQRYEASNYQSASLARLTEIADVLGVRIANSFGAPDTTGTLISWNDPNDVIWNDLPVKEMARRRWFDIPIELTPVAAARDYVMANAGRQFASAFHRKKVRSGGSPNAYALLAWQARILALAETYIAATPVPEFEPNESWLSYFVGLSRLNDGPARAREALAERGIVLIIEQHLQGTYLDGAALLTDRDIPVVGLTLRHDRLDNFWFTLFHEVGHIFRHLAIGLRFDFFDEGDAALTDDLEREADAFALDTLISSHEWDQCLSRFVLTEQAVRLDAERLGVGASIVAGRIRKERDDYTILNSLVGLNEVRAQFPEYAR